MSDSTPEPMGDAARRTPWADLSARFSAFSEGLREYYMGPYRRTFARARRDEDDWFTLVVLAEALGVPDPAAYYTAELMPALYEDFHDWHRRMGMDRSPLDHISCC